MEKKAITLQQLEEALRDMSRWIKDKLKGFLQVPSTEGEPGYVLTTNGDGGYSWEVPHKGDGDSDFIWRPTVSAAGDLSWKKSKETEAPAAVNIKGPGYAANLLDNSDFTNPVNQRGKTDYTAAANQSYTIDRWIKRGSATTPVMLSPDGLTVTNNGSSSYVAIKQAVADDRFSPAGKTVTAAVKIKSLSGTGRLRITGGSVAAGDTTVYKQATFSKTGVFVISCTVPDTLPQPFFGVAVTVEEGSAVALEWAALYEGEYTEDTLPAYQPKGYAAELLECQRYYYRMSADVDARTTITGGTRGINTYFYLPLPVTMRGVEAPTLSYDLLDIYPFESGKSETITFLEATLLSSRNGVALRAVHDTTYTARDAMSLRLKANGYLSLSMDL